MPSRFASIVIVAFWLATAGWYVSRDVWPRITAPVPPYVIDLTDEALRQAVPTRWMLRRNGEKVAPVRTSVAYHEADDSFEMTSSIHGEVEFTVLNQQITIKKYEDIYRVTRGGSLLGFTNDVACSIGGSYFRLLIQATVRGGQANLRCLLESPVGDIEPKLPPFPITQAGVFNPLHPVNRIEGLRPGMRWSLPLVDPVAAARWFAIHGLLQSTFGAQIPQLSESSSTKMLEAEVVGPKPLPTKPDGKSVSCHVIEYRADDYSARTWVRVSDGVVMRQEASAGDEEWVLERE